MVESKILTKQELKLYDEFSTNFTPKTKRDYLLKIIYFKKVFRRTILIRSR